MSDKEQRIRVRAYAIWEGEGRHDGRAEERWRQAELEIEQALRVSGGTSRRGTRAASKGSWQPRKDLDRAN